MFFIFIMEKLELQHLSPYLPNKLKIQGNTNKDIQILKGLVNNDVFVESQTTYHYGAWSDLNGIKPILRPLSDLDKEIEHNDESFIPIERLKLFYEFQSRHGFILSMCIDGRWICSCSELPYDIIERLVEWHFDIFCLISKGLAIDINTLYNGRG